MKVTDLTIARALIVLVLLGGAAVAQPQRALAAVEGVMLGSIKDVAIKGPQTTIGIDVPAAALRRALTHLDTAGAVQLILRNVTADSPPGAVFNVYVAKTSAPATRERVGTLSWFGAFRYRGRTGASRQTRTYDVTAALRALGGPAVADSGLTVAIEAATGRASTDPAGAGQEKERAADAFRVESNLRIGALELRAAR